MSQSFIWDFKELDPWKMDKVEIDQPPKRLKPSFESVRFPVLDEGDLPLPKCLPKVKPLWKKTAPSGTYSYLIFHTQCLAFNKKKKNYQEIIPNKQKPRERKKSQQTIDSEKWWNNVEIKG